MLTLVAATAAVTALMTTRRTVRPLGGVLRMLTDRAAGRHDIRADATRGPSGVRAVAAAVNAMADESDRVRAAERDTARLRGEVRELVAADLGRSLQLARMYEREQHLVARMRELDTAKTDFMSTVSHELRTPLTSIAGYVELLLDAEAGELNAPQTKMLDVIGRNTRRLRDLIEELLILSKIESGAFSAMREPVDLAPLVEHAVAVIAPAAARAELGLHTDVRGPLPLHADPEQLDRVLMNLLANAVKFTPAGGTVRLSARREAGEIVLAVADTGMGIPAGERKALFTRFFRGSNAVRRAVPGAGLGLAIVSTVVDNHAGSIDVESTEGAGATFTIRLPAA